MVAAPVLLEVALSPAGRLHLEHAGQPLDEAAPAAARELAAQFSSSLAAGLLQLAGPQWREWAAPSLAFWRDFAQRYLTALCHVPAEAAGRPVHEPPEEAWRAMADAAPPMKGLEYLAPERLRQFWRELDTHAHEAVRTQAGGLAAFIKQHHPALHLVGRVTFHLAENKKHPTHPFAFLATYTSRLAHDARPQYLPLARALQEFAGSRNKHALVNLLTPVQRAAEKSALVKQWVESNAIYQAQVWTPAEAYRFLQDVPVFEECGVMVRVPDFWKQARPPRPQISVQLTTKKGAGLNADALLDFSVAASLDGQPLAPEEWAQLQQATAGLVFLRGQWVEVDAEKIKALLEKWKRVEQQAAGEGVSFSEGLRLLAGVALPGENAVAEEAREWLGIQAEGPLRELLEQMRSPDQLAAVMPGVELKAELRPYQKTGVNWLHFMSRLGLGACLADDMGLGKTLQVLALLLVLRRESNYGPNLLVAPASLLANWKAEIERFTPSLKALIAHPSELPGGEWARLEKNLAARARQVDCVLTTYGMAARCPAFAALDWHLLALDEAQAIKNPNTRQTKAVKNLRARMRISLTGTPVENRLGDLWSLFDFLNPGLLGTARAFGEYVKQLADGGANRYGPLRQLVRPYILRRLKTDKRIIADLPDKTEVRAFCHLAPPQAALYERQVRDLAEKIEQSDGIERRGLILGAIMRFKQICNHPAHGTGDGDYAPDRSGKFLRLRELGAEIAERQEKILVFTQFQEIIAPLCDFLSSVFGRPGLQLHGGTPVKQRRALVDQFQCDDGPPFFVLSLKAGGTGLNLTAATHVIHFDRWWNPAVENQATDRAYRIGQRRNVLVHKFVCRGTIEEKIDALIEEKTGLARDLLDAEVGARLLTEMSNAELLRFVALDLNRVNET